MSTLIIDHENHYETCSQHHSTLVSLIKSHAWLIADSITSIHCVWVTGQNGIGQNGTYKMLRTKCHGQNGSNFYINWIECIFSNHRLQI